MSEKKKIFITEDEFIVSKSLQNKLESLDYDVVGTATSGEKTLEKIRITKPDLILMDVMLAGELDGIQTAQIIKKEFGIPVIFLTAYSSEEIYRRAATVEPYAYIIKPFEQRELEINISIAFYKYAADKKVSEKQEGEILNQ